MYSYPIPPEDMKIIFEGFLEVASNYPSSKDIAIKYLDYFGYEEKEDR